MKYMSRAQGQGVWLESMSRTITMQNSMLTAITATEKYTEVLDSATRQKFYKVNEQ